MRRLDHAHIIRTIPDREQDRILVLLDKLDHERLLQRRHTTTNDRLAQQRQLQKRLRHLLFKRKCQTLAVYLASAQPLGEGEHDAPIINAKSSCSPLIR